MFRLTRVGWQSALRQSTKRPLLASFLVVERAKMHATVANSARDSSLLATCHGCEHVNLGFFAKYCAKCGTKLLRVCMCQRNDVDNEVFVGAFCTLCGSKKAEDTEFASWPHKKLIDHAVQALQGNPILLLRLEEFNAAFKHVNRSFPKLIWQEGKFVLSFFPYDAVHEGRDAVKRLLPKRTL